RLAARLRASPLAVGTRDWGLGRGLQHVSGFSRTVEINDVPEQIGFIGLGVMGKPMAGHLIKAGHTLTVHNRSRGPVAEPSAPGATAAMSAAEVAAASRVVITMLPDTPD